MPAPACFTCRLIPAGFGRYHMHSAYCANCQPQPSPDAKPDYVRLWMLETGRRSVRAVAVAGGRL
jgi:hypothetical protein